ncbi:MAG TPA: hypothetical protein VD963_02130 [Phycisphaerales bacterium]|nr:hypothetical protein [Phycisphaerales bacterium]
MYSRIHNGAAPGTVPTYSNWDRFNRPTKWTWTKVLGPDRDFFDERPSWDENSNVTAVQDYVHDATVGGTRQFDRVYTLDDLDRLERAQQGTRELLRDLR